MYSTLEDGTVVRGLAGVPQDGPVLLVGNHMLLGIELISLAAEFLRLKGIVVRGIAHTLLFPNKKRAWSEGHDFFDFLNLWARRAHDVQVHLRAAESRRVRAALPRRPPGGAPLQGFTLLVFLLVSCYALSWAEIICKNAK